MKKYILFFILIFPFILFSQNEKPEPFGGIDEVVKYFKGNWYVTFLSKPERDDSRGGKGTAVAVEVFNGNAIEITNSMKFLQRLYNTKLFIGFDREEMSYFANLVNDVSYGIAVNGIYKPENNQFVLNGFSANYEKDTLKYSLVIDIVRKDKFIVNLYHISPIKSEKILELGYIKD